MTILLQMEGITKRFGPVVANENITLDIHDKEILAMLGENGAGKTTLMNILYGLVKPDSGRILLKGNEIQLDSPRKAIQLGIGMIHQHFMLIPKMTVTENIILGQRRKDKRLHLSRRAKEIKAFAEKLGMPLDPSAEIQNLSVGQRQRVEIVKALYRGADLLILDEPTSVLTPQETDELLQALNRLKDMGTSCILITHKLDEVIAASDRVAILRSGKLVDVCNTSQTNKNELSSLMIGHELTIQKREISQTGRSILQVQDLAVKPSLRGHPLNGLSFEIKAGEILGIGGVDGNGQQELAEALAGRLKITEGEYWIDEENCTQKTPFELMQTGVSYIPANRQEFAAFMKFDLATNLMIREIVKRKYTNGPFIKTSRLEEKSSQLIRQNDIRAKDFHSQMSELSGGNQQKVILAREIMHTPKVLIAAQPTRGLDISASESIRRKIFNVRDEGSAILYISTELEELLSTCNRVLILFRGKSMGIFDVNCAPSIEQIGLMMTGTPMKC